jgi:hypothetical protein
MDISAALTVISEGAIAAAALGVAMLSLTIGIKMWKRIRGAA